MNTTIAREPWRTLLLIAQLLSTCGTSIGLMGMAGYVTPWRGLYDWNPEISVPMAFPTAVALSLQGIAIFIAIEYVKRRGQVIPPEGGEETRAA